MGHHDPRYKKLLRALSRFPVEIEKIVAAMRKELGNPSYGVKECLIDVVNAQLEGWAIYHRWESTCPADRHWWLWLDEFQVAEVQREAEGNGVEDRISRLDQACSESRDKGDIAEGSAEGPGLEEGKAEFGSSGSTASGIQGSRRHGKGREGEPMVFADESSIL